MSTATSSSSRWPQGWTWLVFVPPLLAVIGCMITIGLVLKYPDTVISTEPVSTVTDGGTTHVHVTNSVTPPLK